MDPNAALEDARRIAALVVQDIADMDDAYELAEALLALDGWITRGGFLPTAWQHSQTPASV